MPNPFIRTALVSSLLLLGCSQKTRLVIDPKLKDQVQKQNWNAEGAWAEADAYSLVPRHPSMRQSFDRCCSE